MQHSDEQSVIRLKFPGRGRVFKYCGLLFLSRSFFEVVALRAEGSDENG